MTNFTTYNKYSDGLISKFTFIPEVNLPTDFNTNEFCFYL